MYLGLLRAKCILSPDTRINSTSEQWLLVNLDYFQSRCQILRRSCRRSFFLKVFNGQTENSITGIVLCRGRGLSFNTGSQIKAGTGETSLDLNTAVLPVLKVQCCWSLNVTNPSVCLKKSGFRRFFFFCFMTLAKMAAKWLKQDSVGGFVHI